MNVHHLELFYYVAKCEGIMAACRQIPYGIQQPAVSSQIALLEKTLDTLLFHRRPFKLTPPGAALYQEIAPFFSRLPKLEEMVRGTLTQEIRLAGPTEVLRDHLPAVLSEMRRRYPGLRLILHEADQMQAESLIARGETDLAVTIQEETPPHGLKRETLVALPMVLLARKEDKFTSAEQILKKRSTLSLPLIALPPQERLPRLFKDYLRKKRQTWPVSLEVSSNELVLLYVRYGLGIGLSARSNAGLTDPALQEFLIPGAPKLPIGLIWRGKPTPLMEAFMEQLRLRARAFFEGTRQQ